MRINTTWIFALIVVLFTGYAYFFEYQKTINEEEKKNIDSKLIDFDLQDVKRLEIQAKDKDIILSKEADQWLVMAPVQDRANQEEVGNILGTLLAEKFKQLVTADEKADLSVFGLKEPKGSLVVESMTGKKIRYEISTRKNFEGDSFILKEGSKRVLLVSNWWDQLIDKSLRQLRDRKLFPGTFQDIQEVKYRNYVGEEITLIFRNERWHLPGDDGFPLDQLEVHNFIEGLAELEADDVADESKETFSKISDWNYMQVEFKLREGKSWTLKAGREKADKFYAVTEARKQVFSINSMNMKKIAEPGLASFKDKTFPFSFDTTGVTEISIKNDKRTIDFKFEAGEWKTTAQIPKGKGLDQELIKKLIPAARELKVAEFLGPVANKSLDGNKNQITLGNGKESLLSIVWGDCYKVSKKSEKKNCYLKTSRVRDEVFGVDAASINKLLPESFYKNQEPEKIIPAADGEKK